MDQKFRKINQYSRELIILCSVLICCVVLVVAYNIKNSSAKKTSSEAETTTKPTVNIIEVEEKTADISKYYTYGTHCNVFATIDENLSTAKKTEYVLNDGEKDVYSFEMQSKTDDGKLDIYTSDKINEGLCLDELPVGNYVSYVRITLADGTKKNYSLNNKTEYAATEYYTLTRNNSNNKITISFGESDMIKKGSMNVDIVTEILPEDVYDIVIDPGHGGSDPGAVYNDGSNDTYEMDITMAVAKALQPKLGQLGLKVLLTHDGTEDKATYSQYNQYDEDGRVTLTCKSKAKYVISLHCNSSTIVLDEGGIEIYAPTLSDLAFGKNIAEGIHNSVGIAYSWQTGYKEDEGVYVKGFDDTLLAEAKQDAADSDYKAYDISKDTPYLYMIRETGGIATGAYVDGRNKTYGANKYMKSNQGVEGYLIELGYLVCPTDYEYLTESQDKYAEGIAAGVKKSLFS